MRSDPIICAFDGSPPARHAAGAAAWLARRTGARLELVHVVDEGELPALGREGAAADPALREQIYDMQEGRARLAARRALDAAASELEGVETVTSVLDGRPVPTLVALAADRSAALLVSGAPPRGTVEQLLRGSLPASLAAEAACPVVAVPPDAVVGDDGPVIAGDDGSGHAHRAVRHARALAERLGREVVTLDAEHQDPAAALAALAAERRACLVVVGTRGRGALQAALLGSVSLGLVRSAERPVMLVPEAAGEPDA